MHSISLAVVTVLFTLSISVQSHPLQGGDEPEIELQQNQFKQEDPDEVEEVETQTTPRGPSFGPQVAQILKGVATGDLSSILQGSFNLVPNTEVKNNINGAWGTIAGIPITSPAPPATTNLPTTPATSAPPPPPVVVTEAVEAVEAVETATETDTDSTDAPTTSSNNEDDDDEEDADNEELNLNRSGNEENSVVSRSKVLRVI